MIETFEIAFERIEELTKKIAKLNKRAVKVGAPEITMTTGKVFSKAHPTYKGYSVSIVEVTIEGETPKYEGWKFVGTLQPLGNEVVIRGVPGEEIDPKWRKADPQYCGHCNKARYRKETFLARHEDGREIQLGRQCIADFLGGKDPMRIGAWCEMFIEFGASFADEEGSMGYGEPVLEQVMFLAHVAACIEEYGWTSKTKAQEQEGKVATVVDANVNIRATFQPTKYDAKALPVGDKHYDLAKEALEWARAIPEETMNNYLHNVRVVAQCECVGHKEEGISASIVPAYQRELANIEYKKHEAKVAAESAYQGEVGKREVFKELTLLKALPIDGHYGTSTLMMFRDSSGNVYKTFASNPRIVKESNGDKTPEVGETYNVKGTVKAHETYKGCAQTALTRCRIDI